MKKLFLILVMFVPSVLFADEVYLKDAGSISGRVVEQNETTVKVDIGAVVSGLFGATVPQGQC